MSNDEYIHLVLNIMPGILGCLRVVDLTVSSVILLRDGFSQIGIDKLKQSSSIMRGLMKDIDQEKFVEDTTGEGEPPERRMRTHKWSVRHHRHSQGYPEKYCHGESPFTVVHGIIDRGFYEGRIHEAADEHDEHGTGVRAPEIRRLSCILNRSFLFLLDMINWNI